MMKSVKRLIRTLRNRPQTDYPEYSENYYGKIARFTNDDYRNDLAGWQVPAIKEHFGDLSGKVVIDVGAGDIVLGEKLAELGTPERFYVQDLSRPSLQSGIQRLKSIGVDVSRFTPLVSDDFNFESVPDLSVDFAFSNSLFSHLSINSILLCLRNLSSKMKPNAKYMSSMIVVPEEHEPKAYDWSYLRTKRSGVVSYPTRDPYHYAESTVFNLSTFSTGFEVVEVHAYGHPFQKLVEFRKV